MVPGVGLGTCQPASLGQLGGWDLTPGAEASLFAFANEADSLVSAQADRGWPGSQDLTAEVPGYSPEPSSLDCFSPAFSPPCPSEQSALCRRKSVGFRVSQNEGYSPALSLLLGDLGHVV